MVRGAIHVVGQVKKVIGTNKQGTLTTFFNGVCLRILLCFKKRIVKTVGLQILVGVTRFQFHIRPNQEGSPRPFLR